MDVGSDFSGVGAFDQALKRLNIKYNTVFACDMDKYARDTYILNYGEPNYYPENVYDRKIPKESLDIYMTSPPCQSFSLAGKRKGEDDKRGILFFNSHEFIKKNKPRFFIFENVKGLLSDDEGKTFRKWLDYLGGKTINGNPVIFPHEESVPYHIYHKVLNAKKHGVPQNRERIFIVGIRDDKDNNFRFPKEVHLEKRLKDVLEENVDEKYFLSDRMVKYFTDNQKGKGNGRATEFLTGEENNTNCLLSTYYKTPKDGIYIKSATKKGYEIATNEDSINFSVPSSKTRRGRVGKGVAQTLDTACNQGVILHNLYGGFDESEPRIFTEYSPTIRTSAGGGHIPSTITYDYRIRKLTVRECFRLMDFPDTFKWEVSNTQAYKQAGNSIVVACLEGIIRNLQLKTNIE